MKIRQMGADVFHADRQPYWHTGRHDEANSRFFAKFAKKRLKAGEILLLRNLRGLVLKYVMVIFTDFQFMIQPYAKKGSLLFSCRFNNPSTSKTN